MISRSGGAGAEEVTLSSGISADIVLGTAGIMTLFHVSIVPRPSYGYRGSVSKIRIWIRWASALRANTINAWRSDNCFAKVP